MTTQARLDALYGRRGGAMQPWSGDINPVERLCDGCGKAMLGGQRVRHFACDPTALEGRSCTCPPGCSDRRVGDGVRSCDNACAPCRVRRGEVLVRR